MADQGQWFKLWCTAPTDPSLLRLSPSDRWAWVALGCYVRLHGTRGVLETILPNYVLCGTMGITPDYFLELLHIFPHIKVRTFVKDNSQFITVNTPSLHRMVSVIDGYKEILTTHSSDGVDTVMPEAAIVSFDKWHKYQVDTTGISRQKKYQKKLKEEPSRRIYVLNNNNSNINSKRSNDLVLPFAKKTPDAPLDSTKSPNFQHVRSVFEFWSFWMEKRGTTKLTPDRYQKIRARFREGYQFPQFARAIVGLSNSAYHRGENDNGTVYDDLTLICRTGSKLEGFMDKATEEETNAAVERWQQGTGSKT